VLAANRRKNDEEARRVIVLAKKYRQIVQAASIGNEASVDWNDHMVPVERLIEMTRRLKRAIPQPVTFCENYVPWADKLAPLAAELDIISVHTYPVWDYQSIEAALAYTQANYDSVRKRYPDKPVIITEAGWTTASNGRGIEPENASQLHQAAYYNLLMDWTRRERILTFVFEAFDEPWKGSPDPLEPEKHWGLFTVDRRPKLVMQGLYSAG
jgi:exo-beta-1,3-glucanase (GH17 family)